MTRDEPVEVYAARDATEAHFVLNLLAEAGIEARVVGEPLGAATGDLPLFVATPRVWVRPADADRAQPLVEEYRRRLIGRVMGESMPPHLAAEPFCYHCGRAIGRGQTPCPSCGQELDWTP